MRENRSAAIDFSILLLACLGAGVFIGALGTVGFNLAQRTTPSHTSTRTVHRLSNGTVCTIERSLTEITFVHCELEASQ